MTHLSELCTKLERVVKHQPGRHDQSTHGRRGGVIRTEVGDKVSLSAGNRRVDIVPESGPDGVGFEYTTYGRSWNPEVTELVPFQTNWARTMHLAEAAAYRWLGMASNNT